MPPTHIEPSKLRTSPSNPRAIRDNAMEKLMLSIAEDPELMEARPLIVNDRMEVLAGNQRLRACIALEWPTVPCVVVDWDEAKQRRAMIKDNVSAGEWDQDMLANEWEVEELKEMGLNLDWDEPEETEGLTDPDDVPEVPEEPTTKLGDVWLLGEHRLLCGDSTKAEDVERLMNGEKADMVFTDAPYGVDYTGGTKKQKGLQGDTKGTSIYAEFLPLAYKYAQNEASFYFWYAAGYADIAQEIVSAGYQIRTQIVWNKNQAQFGALSAQYKQKHEPCMYAHKKGHAPKWVGPTNEVTVWDVDRSSKNNFHPTQKPVELAQRAMTNHDPNFVLDLFLGSGSTLIAAEKTGRKCYGMELDPKYCDVIVKRWEDFTGKKATLWKQ